MRFVLGFLATMLAVVLSVGAIVVSLENADLEQYHRDCAALGGEVRPVGPELLLCLTDDGRVISW